MAMAASFLMAITRKSPVLVEPAKLAERPTSLV
jgi:hypothetical protein